MATIAGIVTVVMAFAAVLLLLYASFDPPGTKQSGHSNSPHDRSHLVRLHAIRESGMWAAIVALVAAYFVALST